MNFDLDEIKDKAEQELKHEQYRAAVDAYKVKLRRKRWWHILFPWRIVVLRRDE